MSVTHQSYPKGSRLYRQVADGLLELIESGEYPVGSRLPAERELAERFKVSRPTIREAIIALEAKNIVAVKLSSGVYVLDYHARRIEVEDKTSPFELVEARVLIEGEAAALAATMITDEQIIELKQALDLMELENLQDNQASTTADRKFHEVISKATNNSVFPAVIEQLWGAQEDLEHIKLAHQNVCMTDSKVRLNEHTQIYNALASRNPQAARVSMRNHFSRLLKALHDTSEEQAVQEVRQKLNQNKLRFSLDRFVEA